MASTSTPNSAEASTEGANNLDGDTNESKFTYAKASRGATTLVVYHKNNDPFTEEDRIKLGMAFNGTLVGLVEKQGGDGWIPSIDTWRMSSIQKRSVLLVDVPDDKNATWFANWAVKQQVGGHIEVKTLDEYKNMLLKKLTGFAKGETCKMMKESHILMLLRHSAKQKKVTGTIELATVVATPTGAILHILVDNETIETMANVDFELNVGFSGLVKFQDPTGKKSTAKTNTVAETGGVSVGTSKGAGASSTPTRAPSTTLKATFKRIRREAEAEAKEMAIQRRAAADPKDKGESIKTVGKNSQKNQAGDSSITESDSALKPIDRSHDVAGSKCKLGPDR